MGKKKINKIKKYIEFAKIGFKKSIEFKFNYLNSLLGTPLLIFFYYYLWKFIYEFKYKESLSSGSFLGNFTNFKLGGFTFEDMIIYLIIMTLLTSFSIKDLFFKISDLIKSGDIAVYLSKPINFVKSILFESIGQVILDVFILFFLLLIITKLFKKNLPSLTILLFFFFYLFLLILYEILISIFIGGFSFWFIEVWGIFFSYDQIKWVLSGSSIPLSLFPLWLFNFLKFTPFFYMEYTLANIYLNKLSFNEILNSLAIFIFWIIGLLILIRILYKKGLKKMATFGG